MCHELGNIYCQIFNKEGKDRLIDRWTYVDKQIDKGKKEPQLRTLWAMNQVIDIVKYSTKTEKID